MKDFVFRLAVPIMLFLTGSGLAYVTIWRQVRPTSFLAVNESIKAGEPILARSLIEIELPGSSVPMLRNLIPTSQRGMALGRKAVRPLGPNQLLLLSDLDQGEERPEPPRDQDLVYVGLARVAHRPGLLRPGVEVHFLVRPADGQQATRIGPYAIFEGLAPGEPPALDGGRRGDPAIGVLVDRGETGKAEALRRAIADEAIRAIEVVPGIQ